MPVHLVSPSRLFRSHGRKSDSALVPYIERLYLRVEWYFLDTTVSYYRHGGREEEHASLAVLSVGAVEWR